MILSFSLHDLHLLALISLMHISARLYQSARETSMSCSKQQKPEKGSDVDLEFYKYSSNNKVKITSFRTELLKV